MGDVLSGWPQYSTFCAHKILRFDISTERDCVKQRARQNIRMCVHFWAFPNPGRLCVMRVANLALNYSQLACYFAHPTIESAPSTSTAWREMYEFTRNRQIIRCRNVQVTLTGLRDFLNMYCGRESQLLQPSNHSISPRNGLIRLRDILRAIHFFPDKTSDASRSPSKLVKNNA